MKKLCFFSFVISGVLLLQSCNKEDSWKEFNVEYEKKEEFVQKEGVENKFKISYPFFKDYPELNKIVIDKIENEKKYIKDADGIIEHDISFGEVRSSGRYIGFMLTVFTLFEGAAHPQTIMVCVNYDTKEKKEVTLKDVLSPLSKDYLKILSEFTYKELTGRVERDELASSDDFIAEGTDMIESNFSLFNLKGKEVIIVFAQYQVAPYSSGISEVNVPLAIFK